MLSGLKNPTLLSAARIKTKSTLTIHGSNNHALIIRVNHQTEYTFGDKEMTSLRGDAVFIPKGSDYSVKPITDENEFAIIRFIDEGDLKLTRMHLNDLTEALETHAEISRALVFDSQKSRFTALSLFYKLLSLCSPYGESSRRNSRKLALIRPALDRLESDIFSPELRICDLPALCGISDVYFRRLFLEHTGMQPQKYVTKKRLSRARTLLSENPFMKVKEVAEQVGYSDPLYFSRAYKKHFGKSPRVSCD